MADSFFNLEDEPLPSFLSCSLDSTGGRATLGNVTLGAGPGLPVAASTVAKMRAGADISSWRTWRRTTAIMVLVFCRGHVDDVSYLEGGQLSANGEKAKFSLSFKDDMDNADDFIAAHRFSDMLVKVHMDESQSRARDSVPASKSTTLQGRPTELGSGKKWTLLGLQRFLDSSISLFFDRKLIESNFDNR
ncbi:hypothetical protein N1851_001660 [Merluccius polli]|uniref:Uncharacterized protein n=1 Tax=Merluccius polli TaxID=89951 RepID=A0AA47NCV0_MERPO|nr:hypothetical protein N1851_001660 [Merluccius polli]